MTKSTANHNARPELPKEDAALYRLFAVIAYAIIGFAAIITVGKNEGKCTGVFANTFYMVGMLALFAALVFGAVYGKIKNIKGRAFSLAGVCASAAPLVLSFALYNELTRANVKIKFAFIAIIFILFIDNLCPKIYTYVSGAAIICAASVYYLSVPMGTFTGSAVRVLDVIFKVLSYPIAFLIPVFTVYAMIESRKHDGKFRLGKIKLRFSKDKTVSAGLVVLMGALFASAVIVLVWPALLLTCQVAVAVIFAILGIICTIKIL